MKKFKFLSGAALLASLLASPLQLAAADSATPSAPPKPYPLKTCVVSGDKIGGDMGKPVTNIYNGQQIIFCCKDCIKDFNKEPAKYLKKIADAQKAGKDAKPASPAHDHGAQ